MQTAPLYRPDSIFKRLRTSSARPGNIIKATGQPLWHLKRIGAKNQ